MPSPVQRVNAPAFGTEVVVIGGAPPPDWWDPNVAGLCVVAAYRAINTPGNPWTNDAPNVYADTLVNNANPGVFNLVEGNGAVPWAIGTGWSFLGAGAAQWLDTGVVPGTTGWSMLVQFANTVGSGVVAGQYNTIAGTQFEIWPWNFPNRVQYGNGFNFVVPPSLLTGNLGMGGFQGYRNGIADGGPIPGWSGPTPRSVYIGCRNGVAPNWYTGDVESVAIYNCTLTAPQMLAVATAMSQL